MNKWTSMMALSLFGLAGCSNGNSTDIGQTISDGVNGAISGIFGSSNHGSLGSKSYSIPSEKIDVFTPKKAKRVHGNITVTRLEANPTKQTEIILERCFQPLLGDIKCNGNFFPITAEGWLKEENIWLNSDRPDIKIAAGHYYVKMQNDTRSGKYNLAKDVTITPFVTNYITVELE